jgi:hypothetical protein
MNGVGCGRKWPWSTLRLNADIPDEGLRRNMRILSVIIAALWGVSYIRDLPITLSLYVPSPELFFITFLKLVQALCRDKNYK